MLEAAAEEIRVAIQMLRSGEGVCDAGVEEVELRGTDCFPPLALRPGRQQEADQRVFQELIVLAYG